MATNLFVKFKKLMQGSPMNIATVMILNTNGTSEVETAAGGAMRVMGNTIAVGKKVYIKEGVIIGEAPNLTHYEIEI